MAHSPLEQFKLTKVLDLNLCGFDISITNSVIWMVVANSLVLIYFISAFWKIKIIPGRFQMSAEMISGFIKNNVDQNIGNNGAKFIPFIFSIFIFILTSNLFGILPYAFTVTSHISITFALAMIVFVAITIAGLIINGLKFFSLFLPKGTPIWLAPLMIVIELFAYLSRPISLSLRLAANMVAGHVLLKVIAGFVIVLSLYLKFLPIPLIVVLIGFEFCIGVLQAYIFSVLACIYLSDAVNLH